MGKKVCRVMESLVMILLLLGVAVGVAYFIYEGGNYPAGSNTYNYIYRARIVCDEIQQGNWFPLYDGNWFNGQQLLRYVEPLPIYLLSGCFAVAHDVNFGYLLFVAVLCFCSAIGWMWIGYRMNRPKTGFVLGLLWFFTPNNLHTLLLQGNLDESVAMIFLPFLLWNVYVWFCDDGKRVSTVAGVMLFTFLIANCSVTYSIVVALGVILFGVIYSITHKTLGKCLIMLMALVIGVLLFSVWIYPSLYGDGTSAANTEIMKNYFQDAVVSLNPFYRTEGNDQHYYYGLAAFAVALFGVIAGNKKSRTGFVAAIVLFFGTTSSAYLILSKLPGNQFFWMTRYISLAVCLILLSLMYWNTMKRVFYLLCVGLLVLDVIPSLQVNRGEGYYDAAEQTEIFLETTLLERAREITNQRMYFVDGGQYDSVAGYLGAMAEDGNGIVKQSGGNGWEYAATSENVVELNDAVERRHYEYLFDRLLTLGNDTVLIYTDASKYLAKDINQVIAAAKEKGYDLVETKGKYYLFHQDTPETFGVISHYDAIAIGTSSDLVAYSYDSFEVGESDHLDDYSYEDLKDYKLVYLSGFTYDDQKSAEDLVVKLSESGVRVVIDGGTLPTDPYTGIQGFLGVTCEGIMFENGYPILYYNDNEVVCELFPQEEKDWKTVGLNGLDVQTGYLYDNGVEMSFAGYVRNSNIQFVGLGMMYHYYLTSDQEGSGVIVEDILGEAVQTVPSHTIVPLEISIERNQITVSSDWENVNTTLAYTDQMSADENMSQRHHMIVVGKGITTITMCYPYLLQGLLITCVDFAAAILLLIYIGRTEHTKKEMTNHAGKKD